MRSGVSCVALAFGGSASLAFLTATLAPAIAADRHFIATANTYWNFSPSGGFDGAGILNSLDRAIYDRSGTAQSMMPGTAARHVGQFVFLAPYAGSGFASPAPLPNGLLTIHGLNGLGVDSRVNQQINLPARLAIGSTQEWRVDSAGGGVSLLTSGAARGFDLGGHTLTLNAVNAANYFRFDNVVAGAGGIVVTGAGTTFLTASNTFSGGAVLKGGALSVASDANLGSGALTFDGGVLQITGAAFNSTPRAINWGAGGGGFDIADAANIFTVSQSLAGGPLGKYGAGRLNLTGVNTYAGPTTITAGTLALIGGASIANSSRVHVDGLFDISATTAGAAIRSLSGGGVVEIGGKTLTLTAADDAFAGVLQGGGALTITGGMETLSGDSSGFTGLTTVQGGTLSVNNALGGVMRVTGGRLQGVGSVGDTTSFAGGVIAPGNSIGVLTIAGDYTGNGGVLEIESVLGGDASPSDRLVVTGDTFGSTNVKVINLGGGGGPTTEGIKIVDVQGASSGAFALLGDYVFHGEQAVIGGAYAYTLHKNGVATPADGDWYLRSRLANPAPPVAGPIYQPGAPLYEAYPQALLALNSLPTLRQRAGDSRAAGAARPGEADGMVWGRAAGAYTRAAPSDSATVRDYDIRTWQARVGVDGALLRNEAGTLIGGATAHYGQAIADVRSKYGDGRIATLGGGVGGSLTWYGVNGFYVDGQAQGTVFDSSFKSSLVGRGMASGVGALGYALSLEAGRAIGIGEQTALTPQAQLTYSAVTSDFKDNFGADVSLGRGDSLTGRLGLALDRRRSWRDAGGRLARANVYGVANLYYEFLQGASVSVSGSSFAMANEKLTAGFGFGGAYRWSDDRYSLYGEALVRTSFNDDYSVGGLAGFRVRW